MMWMMEQMMEADRLEVLKQELRPAYMRGEKKCVKCGFCCHKRTCIPTPEELKKIAKFLDLSVKDCINRYFAVDRPNFSESYHLKPIGINIRHLAGKFIPCSETYGEGRCIFLEKDGKQFKCKIYSVRPKSAKVQNCWVEGTTTYHTLDYWKKDTLKKEFGMDGGKLEAEAIEGD